jgi:hypothetical protein
MGSNEGCVCLFHNFFSYFSLFPIHYSLSTIHSSSLSSDYGLFFVDGREILVFFLRFCSSLSTF